MAVVRLLINGQVPVPSVAAPPPAVPPAPPPPPAPAAPVTPPYFLLNPVPAPPPQLPPASASSGVTPELLAAAGVTPEQYAEAEAAATYAAAGAAALLAGQGSAGIASAEQAAGAPDSVVQAVLDLGIPDISQLVVTGTGGDDGSVGDTDDLDASAALANANAPDLSNLPPWELDDPFGERTLAAANPVLKGGGALTAIAQACVDYGVDPMAAIADALHEGANGGIGDGGLAYGPFQDHLTEFPGRPFYGKGRNNPVVNAWAWTANGIRYSVRAMVNTSPSAKGLLGHAAVYAIVYGYERPADKPGAYKTRAAEYDHLVKLGKGWPSYAADLMHGPAAGGATDTKPITGGSSTAYKPAGVVAQWRDFVNVFRLTVPAKHSAAQSWDSTLVGVFK